MPCDTVGSQREGPTVVVVSYSGKEINAKLVYYGAGLCGKTTNLEAIYEAVPETSRGKMVSMKTQSDRTLFFDLLPLDLGEIMGFKTRFLLYTVPGQVFYNATRKLVLKGADAIVFVADSQVGKMDENLESLQNLRQNLSDYGLRLDDIPWVLQYNKRDLPNVYSIGELNASLNPGGNIPIFESVASQGTGVFETFRGISHLLMQKVTRELHRSPQGAAAARAARSTADSPPKAPEPAAPPPAREPVATMDGQRNVDIDRPPSPSASAPDSAFGRDALAAPAGFERIGSPTSADRVIREPAAAEQEAPSLAFEIDRGTPPPPGAGERTSPRATETVSRRSNTSEGALFEDEPPGLVIGSGATPVTATTPPAPAKVTAAPPKFEERTLALGDPAPGSRTQPVAIDETAAAERHEVSIPLTIPAGETREIVLRITIRPVR
jgi:hypothetical protein